MKLLCLNLWGGRQGKALLDFIKEQSSDADIFCFQEVFDSQAGVKDYESARPQLFSELQEILPEFIGYFDAAYGGRVDFTKVKFEISEGQAIFIREGIE